MPELPGRTTREKREERREKRDERRKERDERRETRDLSPIPEVENNEIYMLHELTYSSEAIKSKKKVSFDVDVVDTDGKRRRKIKYLTYVDISDEIEKESLELFHDDDIDTVSLPDFPAHVTLETPADIPKLMRVEEFVDTSLILNQAFREWASVSVESRLKSEQKYTWERKEPTTPLDKRLLAIFQ